MIAALKSKVCRICDDTGWEIIIDDGIDKVRRCNCFSQKNVDLLRKKSKIPKRYSNCTIEKFRIDIPCEQPDLTDPERPQIDLATARQYAKDFVRKYPDNKKGLFFMGKCGVGKTHLAVGIILELMKKKAVPCLFYDFRDLLKEIQASYDSRSSVSEISILGPVFNTDVLVLDELGASKVTDWMRDMLTHIINKRYNERKMTIITSNWMDHIENEGEDTLTDRIGVRLRSRLYEMCRVIELIGLGWTDIAIANYLGSDRVTVKRVRKKFVSGTLMV